MDRNLQDDVLAPLAECEVIAASLVQAFTAVGVTALTIPVEFDGAQVEVSIRVAAEPKFTADTVVGHSPMPDGIATALGLPEYTRAFTLTCEAGSVPVVVSVEYYPLKGKPVLAHEVFALAKSQPAHPDDSDGGHCD